MTKRYLLLNISSVFFLILALIVIGGSAKAAPYPGDTWAAGSNMRFNLSMNNNHAFSSQSFYYYTSVNSQFTVYLDTMSNQTRCDLSDGPNSEPQTKVQIKVNGNSVSSINTTDGGVYDTCPQFGSSKTFNSGNPNENGRVKVTVELIGPGADKMIARGNGFRFYVDSSAVNSSFGLIDGYKNGVASSTNGSRIFYDLKIDLKQVDNVTVDKQIYFYDTDNNDQVTTSPQYQNPFWFRILNSKNDCSKIGHNVSPNDNNGGYVTIRTDGNNSCYSTLSLVKWKHTPVSSSDGRPKKAYMSFNFAKGNYILRINQLGSGNFLSFSSPLDEGHTEEPEWTIKGESYFDNNPAVKLKAEPKGSTVTFYHRLVNNGPDNTNEDIDGDVIPNKDMPNCQAQPPTATDCYNYRWTALDAAENKPAGTISNTSRSYTFNNTGLFCEYASFKPTSNNNANSTNSDRACVYIYDPSPTALNGGKYEKGGDAVDVGYGFTVDNGGDCLPTGLSVNISGKYKVEAISDTWTDFSKIYGNGDCSAVSIPLTFSDPAQKTALNNNPPGTEYKIKVKLDSPVVKPEVEGSFSIVEVPFARFFGQDVRVCGAANDNRFMYDSRVAPTGDSTRGSFSEYLAVYKDSSNYKDSDFKGLATIKNGRNNLKTNWEAMLNCTLPLPPDGDSTGNIDLTEISKKVYNKGSANFSLGNSASNTTLGGQITAYTTGDVTIEGNIFTGDNVVAYNNDDYLKNLAIDTEDKYKDNVKSNQNKNSIFKANNSAVIPPFINNLKLLSTALPSGYEGSGYPDVESLVKKCLTEVSVSGSYIGSDYDWYRKYCFDLYAKEPVVSCLIFKNDFPKLLEANVPPAQRANCVTVLLDDDNDGFINLQDKCITVAGKINGCPDTDGDGILDKDDSCPSYAGVAVWSGCTDNDNDKVTENKDKASSADKCYYPPEGKTPIGASVGSDGCTIATNNIRDGGVNNIDQYYRDHLSKPVLVVKAKNIYISDNVTRVDAILMAENIYTCSKGTADNSSIRHNCNKALVINGALYATNKVHLLRSTGTRFLSNTITNVNSGLPLGQNGGGQIDRSGDSANDYSIKNLNPAEVINMPGFLNFMPLNMPNDANSSYDTYTTLPPRL